MNPEQPSSSVDMGVVYDHFADDFAKSDVLPTWKYVGKPVMTKLLTPFFGRATTFLDLGSASGRVEAGILLEHGVAPEQITGVEISKDQVVIAQKRIPGAHFIVGDITKVSLPPESYDVVFSHMVFEHLDNAQLLAACKIAHTSLKPGGTFAFVVTHPDKMTDLNENLVTTYGHFQTTAPWGGVLDNWRRSVEDTVAIVQQAGFTVQSKEEIAFPENLTDLTEAEREEFMKAHDKYSKYPAIRLALVATK